MTLKTNPYVTFGLVLALMLALGVVATAKTGSIDARAETVGAHGLPNVDAIRSVDAATTDYRGIQNELALTSDAAGRSVFVRQLDERRFEVRGLFPTAGRSPSTRPTSATSTGSRPAGRRIAVRPPGSSRRRRDCEGPARAGAAAVRRVPEADRRVGRRRPA
jgi:hypothetical protein